MFSQYDHRRMQVYGGYNHGDKLLYCLSLVRLTVLKYYIYTVYICSIYTSTHLFSPLSLLTAALSSLQLPLSLYLLTHLSRGEVVTQHEGVVSFPVLFSLTCLLLFLCFPSFLLSFTACDLLSEINNSSLWCSIRAVIISMPIFIQLNSFFVKLTFHEARNRNIWLDFVKGATCIMTTHHYFILKSIMKL